MERSKPKNQQIKSFFSDKYKSIIPQSWKPTHYHSQGNQNYDFINKLLTNTRMKIHGNFLSRLSSTLRYMIAYCFRKESKKVKNHFKKNVLNSMLPLTGKSKKSKPITEWTTYWKQYQLKDNEPFVISWCNELSQSLTHVHTYVESHQDILEKKSQVQQDLSIIEDDDDDEFSAEIIISEIPMNLFLPCLHLLNQKADKLNKERKEDHKEKEKDKPDKKVNHLRKLHQKRYRGGKSTRNRERKRKRLLPN